MTDIEKVAMAIYESRPRHPRAVWISEPPAVRDGIMHTARAAIAEIERQRAERGECEPPPDQPEGIIHTHSWSDVTCAKADACQWPECHCGPKK